MKLHLAGIRMLFDWLVVGHVLAVNPASPVRGPKHKVRKGKTPVLSAEEARALLHSIDPSSPIGPAGIWTRIGNHSFRATGITEYLRNGDGNKGLGRLPGGRSC